MSTCIADMEICTKLQYNVGMEREPQLNVQRVREEMQRQGLKMPGLAAKIGVAYETLYKALSEENRRVSAEMVARLAGVFGCSIEYLMDLTEDREPRSSKLGEILAELTEVARNLTDRRQRDLLLTARAYLEASKELRADPDLLMDNMLDLIHEAGGTVSRNRLIDFMNQDDDGLLGGAPDDGEEPADSEG